MTDEDVPGTDLPEEHLPVAASYLVRITMRGRDVDGPTTREIENAIGGVVAGLVVDGKVTVTASAERTDR